MSQHVDSVIVGGGHGRAHAAIMLRPLGVAGSIAIVGSEPELPSERPPLSKEYFASDKIFGWSPGSAKTVYGSPAAKILIGSGEVNRD